MYSKIIDRMILEQKRDKKWQKFGTFGAIFCINFEAQR